MIVSRRILAAAILLCVFSSPSYAQKSKAALTAEINNNWPDNTTGSITPAIIRSTVTDIINSYYDLNGGTSLACAANQWVAGLPTLSSLTCTQPAFSNISGQASLTQLPTIGVNTVLCSIAGGTPIACTQAQVTTLINVATASLSGAVPAWPNNTTTFFRGDGTYATLNLAAIGGFGTGVATALGVATNSNGGFPIYSSGTWTPGLSGTSSGSATYTSQTGSYEIIGRQVHARFKIVTATTASIIGTAQLTGLPATVANTANDYGGCFVTEWSGFSLSAGFVYLSFRPAINTTVADFLEIGGTTSNAVAFGAGQMGSTITISGTCIYHT